MAMYNYRPRMHRNQMLFSLVNWKISSINGFREDGKHCLSEYDLNDEWTLVVVWSEMTDGLLKPNSVEIHRKTICEEISISGELLLQYDRQILSRREEFTKLIKAGSSKVNLIDFDPKIFENYSYLQLEALFLFSVHGFVGISSAADLKKCVHVKSREKLSNDFERLLNSETCCFSDVNLKCGSISIPAHKNILATRSPIFAAMFSNPMLENSENEVDISDMNASVVRTMLTYVYTGRTPDLTISMASDLLYGAEKYQLHDLKTVCCNFLEDNISLQNVLSVLVQGDLYSENLKTCALNFISETKFSVLEETEEWKDLRKERPDLAIDILISMVKSREM